MSKLGVHIESRTEFSIQTKVVGRSNYANHDQAEMLIYSKLSLLVLLAVGNEHATSTLSTTPWVLAGHIVQC